MADHPARGGNGYVPDEEVVPAATEEVHLPGPTYLPAIVALGTTLALVGVVISYVVMAIGLIITAAALLRWIRETREDMAELPQEH